MPKRIKLGCNFADTLSVGSGRARGSLVPSPLDDDNRHAERVLYFFGLCLVGLVVLVGRLVYLSIFNNEKYRNLSDNNRIRQEIIRAPRGMILDRNNLKLTQNVPVYRLEVRSKDGQVSGYKTIKEEEALSLQARGLPVIADPGRTYPQAGVFSHVLGFIGEISAESLKKPDNKFELGDMVGQGGLEQQYDILLRGKNGRRMYETDTAEKIVRILGEEQPIPGVDLHTSLDSGLQQAAMTALAEKDGAVVVLEASTGAVLALASSPTFDPNLFTSGAIANQATIEEILKNPEAPLINRTIGGVYPAGSTFKIVVTAAALVEKKIPLEYTFDDPGFITAGTQRFYNWAFSQHGKREGVIDASQALARSTDTFFYTIGALVGPEGMTNWSEKFRFGQTSGIDLPGEMAGLIPTPEWKQKVKGERWYLGNTYNMSIGQGDVLVTPLQVAQMTQVVANNGWICTPRIAATHRYSCQNLNIPDEVLRVIKKGMIGACSPGGTSFPLFNFSPPVACKSGTAQYGVKGKLTHAWLTAYAPADVPQVVVTVLVEGGGEGSAVAAPLVKDILNVYFRNSDKVGLATPSAHASETFP